jgi:DNA-binding CsgD family transcriptional regulator
MSTTFARQEDTQALHSAVKVAELICGLPAVATQDWCDKAAGALLPIVGTGACVVLIGQFDERGGIHRSEATGVAGCIAAEITTTVGKPLTATSTVMQDPNDAALARIRTNLAQARELNWPIGGLGGGAVRVGTPATLSAGNAAAQMNLLKRWDAVPHGTLLLGAVSLGQSERVMVIELAPAPGVSRPTEVELSVLESVLPLLSRRAILAIGSGPAESAHWLTAREQIILQHLLMGKSVREIAEELGRSPHTVHDHVKSLHRKLNASSRGELVARALGYMEVKPAGETAAAGEPAGSSPEA